MDMGKATAKVASRWEFAARHFGPRALWIARRVMPGALLVFLGAGITEVQASAPSGQGGVRVAQEGVHPQVLFGPEDIGVLRARAASEVGAPIWRNLKSWVDLHLADPLPQGPLDRFVAETAPRAAMAYLITGEDKYARRSVEWMLHLVDQFPDWRTVYGNGGTSYLVNDIALAYDWVYGWSGWAQAEKDRVRDRLTSEVPQILPECDQRHRSYTAIGLAGYALLGEAAEAPSWIEQSRQWYLNYMSQEGYGSDGFWASGAAYGGDQLWEASLLFAAAEYHGDRYWDTAWSLNQRAFWIYTYIGATKTYDYFPFGDNYWYELELGSSSIDPYLLGMPAGGLAAFSHLFQDRILQYVAREQFSRHPYHLWHPAVLWMLEPEMPTTPPDGVLPLSHHFADFDAVVAKSGWTEQDTHFYMKTAVPNGHVGSLNGMWTPSYEGHANPDANGLLIFSRGEWLATTNAYAVPKYTNTSNTVLVDGAGQTGEGVDFMTPPRQEATGMRLRAVLDTGSAFYVLGDASTGYGGLLQRFQRHVLFFRPDLFVVLDELSDDQLHRYEWMLNLHQGHGWEDLGNSRFRVLGTRNADMGVALLRPLDSQVTKGVHVVGRDGQTAPYVSFASPQSSSTQFLVVLEPVQKSAAPTSVEQLDVQGGTGHRLGSSIFILASAEGSDSVSLGGMRADGRFAYWKGTEGHADAILGGSVRSIVMDPYSIEASSPISVGFDGLRGEVSAEAAVELTVRFPGLQGVILDGGNPFPVSAGSSSVTIPVPMGRHQLQILTGQSPTFADVPFEHPFHDDIEILYQNGYTAGCATDPLRYCPEATMNRAESSVFVERGIHTASYDPPAPTSQVFADVPLDSWAAKWVNGLWVDQYTAGCGTNPLVYCPWQGHTRAEGCVFYLRMLNSADYEPPQPSQQTFVDVPLDTWYAKWVQAGYDAGLLTACETTPELRFCPDDPLTRALAAYMMVRAKGLQ